MKTVHEFFLKEVFKASENVKIPQSMLDELAYLRKDSLSETGVDGYFLITVMKKDNVITDDLEIVGKLADIQVETAKVLLSQAIAAVKGNGEDNGKVRIKLTAKI
ncbi:MAG: hypothetical protein ACWA41_08870 [Putridiphycobacter sp.]